MECSRFLTLLFIAISINTNDALNIRQNTEEECSECEVNGQTYRGHSRFEYREGCLNYRCICHCDGSWDCPPSSTVDMCERESSVNPSYNNGPALPIRKSGSCSKCIVQEDSFTPNSNFTLKQGCLEYQCHCNCDGAWYCPSQSPKTVCDARAIQRKSSSCQSCDVRGAVYPADATFVLREGCHQHTCTCNCDGTWRCPFNSTINVCESLSGSSQQTSHQSLGSCKPCAVNGKTYMTNSDFQFREDCSLYECHCFCNGSWSCPAEKTKNMCQAPDYRIDGCKECRVKNETYPGGSPFSYREGCWEFNCMCGCDGKWNCPPTRSSDICRSVRSSSSRCKPCHIESKVIKSKSSFNLRQGCNEYLCECGCDGKLNCPEERSINTCELEGQPGVSKSDTVAKGCKIGNRTFYRRIFGYTEDCLQYTCICFDNGAWRCPSSKTKRVC